MERQPPRIMIHGGFADELSTEPAMLEQKRLALTQIVDAAHHYYMEGNSAVDTAVYTTGLLEANPLFNAGLGSRIQEDGHVRQSASLMDGKTRKFASVTNMEGILNPGKVVHALWQQESRRNTSLAPPGANDYAAELGYIPLDYNTSDRVREWEEMCATHQAGDTSQKNQTGTVGCVISAPQEDGSVEMVVMTSTGGTSNNRVGRMGDSSSPAGNFASEHVAVSMTGTGEEIINHAIASSIAALVDYAGMSIEEAAQKVFASAGHFDAGAIIVDSEGHMLATDSQPKMMWARHDGQAIEVVSTRFDTHQPIGTHRTGDIVSEEMLERARAASFDVPTLPLPFITHNSSTHNGRVEDKQKHPVKYQ